MTSLQNHNLTSMSDKEFLELVWEDGQLLMRGFPKRTEKKYPSCIGHSSHSSSATGDHFKDGRDSIVPPKTPKFGAADSILINESPHDNKKDFYLNLAHNNSLLDNKHHESLPELYQQHFNEFSVNDKGNSYDKFLKDSQVVPVHEYTNSKPGYASNHLSSQPGQLRLQQYQPSTPIKRPRVSPNLASPGSLRGSNLREQDSEPDRERETVNFSLFMRSPAMSTSSRGFSKAEDLKTNGKMSVSRNDKLFESLPIAAAATASKIVKGFQNQLSNAEKLPPIAEVPDKALPDDQSEAVRNKRSSNHEVYQQTSCLPANTVKGKLNTEKSVEPAVASSSFCSRGASNNPTYTFKRRYEETDGSACPSDDNFEEKPTNVKKAVPARGSKCNRKRRTAEVHNLSERKRRDRINKKMRALQELIPNCNKVDKASMLDEAIEYLKSLQFQVQMMSMGTGVFMPPPMMVPARMQQIHAPQMAHFSPMGVGMGMRMQMGVGCGSPQFLIPPIPGAMPLPGLAETRIQMPAGFPGQPLPISAMFRAPLELMQKTVPIAGVSRPAASMEFMDSAPLTNSKDSVQKVEINNKNLDCSKNSALGLPLS